MSERFDIVVVGAGLVGTAFALNVARNSKLKVALVERGPTLQTVSDNQRVVALGRTATNLLDELGVLASLMPSHAHAYNAMYVWDENSHGELHFQASDLGVTELGFMVDAQACTKSLQKFTKNGQLKNLHCYFETECQDLSLQRDQATLQTAKGALRAKLIVGADGARSWVRQQAKIFANRRSYSQHGIVAKILTSDSHKNCAWQRFLATGPVAALPVADNYSSIVWSADQSLANELMQMDDAGFMQALAQAFEYRLGNVTEIGQRQSFPLASQQASTYYAPSLALIGDAAHSIHPLAGQGANLGFKDAVALSKLACSWPSNRVGSLAMLSDYERLRRPDNQQTDWLMSALNTGFSNKMPWWLALRGLGMNWLDNRQKIKNVLAQQAIGS